MPSFSRSPADTIGGGLIMLFALGVIVEGARYPIGTLNRMGPGFLPIVMGVVLAMLGVAIIFAGDGGAAQAPKNMRAPAFVFAGLIAWGLLLERVGLIIATMVLIGLAAFAHPKPNPRRVLITLVVLPLASTALFIYGLRLPIKPVIFF
ncbi:tripartite tricarboxylate transporter TctB family protein [Chelativorans sp. AA-79]|uniref:tripartite tricarboxylate transporter TctB family protein n=1 Tax=Chelativorans sp. AA-79 TaxID=3028735 RepID=UPI0023F7B6C4|nr:tripartite tricarboxylate transporter TctB family protein [Chelativorans sp. AA-79]WEX09045.1 tripartite tricarboxylate transporter TctB family protein [Chelativorans sp. AA-79]